MSNVVAYVVVVDGKVIGTWRRTLEKRTVRIHLTPFRKLGGAERRAVTAATARFTHFMGYARTGLTLSGCR